MTDRYNALTVILDRDIRDDDAAHLLNAIKMLRGVLRVEPHIANNLDAAVAEMRVRNELVEKLIEVLRPPSRA